MNPMKEETKTLIVTETIRHEFTVPASMSGDRAALTRYFDHHPDPWGDADFAAVNDRHFELESLPDDSEFDSVDPNFRTR
jgi:hypothetical protein